MPREISGADIGAKAGTAFTRRNIDKFRRTEDLAVTLAPLFFDDLLFFRDDFDGDTINLDKWVVSADTGITAFAIPAPNTAGGIISSDTLAEDNEFTSIYGPPIITGDKNGGMMVRWKVSDVADICLEMGLTDPLSDYTLPAVNDIDTPTITNGAADVAVLVMDTDQTLTTLAFLTDGGATYDTGKTNLSSFTTPTADTWYKTIVQLKGDTAILEVYDDTTPSAPILKERVVRTSAVEGGNVMQPWFIYGNRTTDGGVATIDYIAFWVER